MGQSILVFVSHSSEDKAELIEPIVKDIEDCYINVWLDKRKILPGDNLRKSIFRDGLDKADIALIFFTQQSLKSSWVDREIKHVLREESKKGNDFDLNKIISIFDSEETYNQIAERYPELTDDLLHLMPKDYNKIQLGQLISAIWSKYLSIQGGDIETQKKLLAKDRELFSRDKTIHDLTNKMKELKSKNSSSSLHEEFEQLVASGKINGFISESTAFLTAGLVEKQKIKDISAAMAFGLAELAPKSIAYARPTDKGVSFIKWLLLREGS